MIFEALSALADANGSDVSSIFHFIEVRQISLCSSLCIDQKSELLYDRLLETPSIYGGGVVMLLAHLNRIYIDFYKWLITMVRPSQMRTPSSECQVLNY